MYNVMATSFYLNKRSGTQFYDWKPMRSIKLKTDYTTIVLNYVQFIANTNK